MSQAQTAKNQEWRVRAACLHLPPSMFFPLATVANSRVIPVRAAAAIRKAQGICACCPVKRDCYRFATDNGEREGIWGGVLWRYGLPVAVGIGSR